MRNGLHSIDFDADPTAVDDEAPETDDVEHTNDGSSADDAPADADNGDSADADEGDAGSGDAGNGDGGDGGVGGSGDGLATPDVDSGALVAVFDTPIGGVLERGLPLLALVFLALTVYAVMRALRKTGDKNAGALWAGALGAFLSFGLSVFLMVDPASAIEQLMTMAAAVWDMLFGTLDHIIGG